MNPVWKERGRHYARYAARRFSEPSSWMPLGAALTGVGYHMDDGLLQAIAYIGAGVCWFLCWALPEGSGE